MGRIVIRTELRAPIERCFDLARDVEAHCRTSAFTAERAVPPGRTAGLLELGDTVTFEGRHFGLRLRLTARIVEMQRPFRFVDEANGAGIERLRHVHEFHARDDVTEMIDTMEWTASFGILGKVADRLFLERYLAWFVRTKQLALKRLAEGDGTD